jgi:uncharacterized membrane protein YbaN (DUF454 family)
VIKQLWWKILGFISLGFAYIGVITPGIPYSPFVVFSAYCFAKSSPRMHAWIMNHKIFGKFINNWNRRRVFPLKLKFFMLASMSFSLILMIVGNVSTKGIVYTAIFMACTAIWAWRYPSSVEEHDRRIAAGRKIGWFNNNF